MPPPSHLSCRSRAVVLAVLLSWAAPGSGAAQAAQTGSTDDQARVLFRRAETHFAAQRYRPALRLYQRAFELRPLPGFLFNVAQCHRLLGETDQAIVFFREYLRRYPDSPHRQKVEQLIARLQGSSTTPHTAPSPDPRGALAGAASTASLAPPAEASPAQPAAVSNLQKHETRTDGQSSRLRKALLWSGVGLSAALLTTGLVTGQLASNKADAYAKPGPPDEREELKRSGQALRATSIATLISGGVVAVATALYLWLGD